MFNGEYFASVKDLKSCIGSSGSFIKYLRHYGLSQNFICIE